MKSILLLQVATESDIVEVMVVEALAIARARGGVYRVVCRTGPWAGQQSVLKHGGRPEELAQLRERRVNTANWHQVSFWINLILTAASFSYELHCGRACLLP